MLPGESKLVTIQLALFPRDIPQLLGSGITSFVDEFNSRLGNVFNAAPVILPIPPDAPGEIPRVILKSEPNRYSCNIAKSRIDFFIFMNSTFNVEDIRTGYHQKITNLSNFLQDKGIEILRIGYISSFETNLSTDHIEAADYLRQHFIVNDRFQEPLELGLRYVRRTIFNQNIDTNIVTTMNQKGSGRNLERNSLIIQYDINSAPERTENITTQQIIGFCTDALSEVEVLTNNFPAI